jgi:hypothetical protein
VTLFITILNVLQRGLLILRFLTFTHFSALNKKKNLPVILCWPELGHDWEALSCVNLECKLGFFSKLMRNNIFSVLFHELSIVLILQMQQFGAVCFPNFVALLLKPEITE